MTLEILPEDCTVFTINVGKCSRWSRIFIKFDINSHLIHKFSKNLVFSFNRAINMARFCKFLSRILQRGRPPVTPSRIRSLTALQAVRTDLGELSYLGHLQSCMWLLSQPNVCLVIALKDFITFLKSFHRDFQGLCVNEPFVKFSLWSILLERQRSCQIDAAFCISYRPRFDRWNLRPQVCKKLKILQKVCFICNIYYITFLFFEECRNI